MAVCDLKYCPAVRILILGAAGMLGSKLARRLARDRTLAGVPIGGLTLADVVEPAPPESAPFPTEAIVADLVDAPAIGALIAARPDVVFHLAAVVSGEAETDFEKGYRVNVHGTQRLLEAIRSAPEYRPKLVFTSSIVQVCRRRTAWHPQSSTL